MGSFEKISEDRLPDKCKFYSSIKDECVSDYQKHNSIWKVFKMYTMDDYDDLYLKIDGLLLADV